MKIITVAGYKGGESMTAIHVTMYPSDREDVVLVDDDLNRTAITWDERGQLPFDLPQSLHHQLSGLSLETGKTKAETIRLLMREALVEFGK